MLGTVRRFNYCETCCERRKEIARNAAKARWDKKRREESS